MMFRAFIHPVSPQLAEIPSDEAHHLVKVRRLRKGDRFLGLDGEGGLFVCRLERGKRGWTAHIEKPLHQSVESPLQTTLGQALLKKDNFEWVIQKASELGVQRIVPLITSRTEVRPRPDSLERKMSRWHKILAEAAKQCGRLQPAALEEPVPLEDFCARQDAEIRLVLDEAAQLPLWQAVQQQAPPHSCSIIIGPEGGWDDRDRQAFSPAWTPVRLGPRILRAETAPVAALSILQYLWGDLGREP